MSKDFRRSQRQAKSEAVDEIFQNYTTIISSSETEDEGVQASDLPTFEQNTDARDRPSTLDLLIGRDANKHTEATSTIEPHRTQLPSTSNAGVYARKTIPSASLLIGPQDEESDVEISEIEGGAPTSINIPSCDHCYEYGITCRKKTRGHACVSCGLKRIKCSLVPEMSQKPGARGTSTDNGSENSGQPSTDFSFEDDTGDESFELDSEKVTQQRVLAHVLRLNRKQEEWFGKLEELFGKFEICFQELNKKIEGVREEPARLTTAV